MAGRRAIENLKRLLLLFVERNRKVKNCYNVGGECSLRKKEREILSCVSLSLSYSPSFQFFPSPPLPFLPPGTRLISELSVGVIASARERYGFSSPLLPPPFSENKAGCEERGGGREKVRLVCLVASTRLSPPLLQNWPLCKCQRAFFLLLDGWRRKGQKWED